MQGACEKCGGQDRTAAALKKMFPDITVADRRQQPSNGYRAVHLIVSILGKRVEIQIRTSLQHLWAEISEKLADVLGPDIKYGGGEELYQGLLTDLSKLVTEYEDREAFIESIQLPENIPEHMRLWFESLTKAAARVKEAVFDLLKESVRAVEDATVAAYGSGKAET